MAVNEQHDFLIAGGLRIDLSWLKTHYLPRGERPTDSVREQKTDASEKFLDLLFERGVFTDRETYKKSSEYINGRYLSRADRQQECLRTLGRTVTVDWRTGAIREFTSKMRSSGTLSYIDEGQRIFFIGLSKGTTLTGAEYASEVLDLATGELECTPMPKTWSGGGALSKDRRYLLRRDTQRAWWLYTVPELKLLGRVYSGDGADRWGSFDMNSGDLMLGHIQKYQRFDLGSLQDPPPSYAEQSRRLGYTVKDGEAVSRF